MEKYFTNQLDEGKEFKVCYMVHNAYWYFFQTLNNRYENCFMDVYGSSISYFKMRHRDFGLKNDYDYDLIIEDSSDMGLDLERLEEIRNWASRISKEKEHRVTVGCTYYVPLEERVEGEPIKYVNVSSFDLGTKILEENIPYTDAYTYEIIDLVSQKHNELEKPKTYGSLSNSVGRQ